MAYDNVAIANLALKRIGVKQTIAALSDTTQEARACNLLFEHSRDTVLDCFPWPFAMRYETLALVEDFTDDDDFHDWAYSYRYPTECLKLRRLVTGDRQTSVPFEIGGDDTGRLILTDEVDAKAQYTVKVSDPTQFSPSFADAFIWRLAADLAMPLSVSDTIRAQAETMYAQALSRAQAAARNEAQRDEPEDSEAIQARD